MRLFKTSKYGQLVIVGRPGRVGHLPVRGPVDQFSGCSSLHVSSILGQDTEARVAPDTSIGV